MTLFTKVLANFFRSSNSKLIYPQSWLLEKGRKAVFFISVRMYKRWMSGKKKSQQELVSNVDGTLTMRLDVSKAMGASFYWTGFHEFNEWRYLQSFLKPEMTLFDVGANQGEYSLFSAKRLTNGKVYAFEPVSVYYHQLSTNKILNKFTNLETYSFGLSDQEGALPVYMEEVDSATQNEGLASLFKGGARTRLVETIELRILDRVVDQLKLHRLDFIKIDVEGAELNVLQGAKETIMRYRPTIMVEISSKTFEVAGYCQQHILDYFTVLNYAPFLITKKGDLAPTKSLPSFSNVVFRPI